MTERETDPDALCRCGHPRAAHSGIYDSCSEYRGHGQSCRCAGYRPKGVSA